MSAPKIIMAEAANAGGSGGVEGGAPAPAAPPAPPLTDRVPTPRNGINIEYGEGSNPSPSSARRRPFGTLGGVMRGPSTLPDVVVLDSLPDGLERKETLDPKEDLWLSTSDGYVQPPTPPSRVIFCFLLRRLAICIGLRSMGRRDKPLFEHRSSLGVCYSVWISISAIPYADAVKL